MAQNKPSSSLTPLRPLPIRIAQLHAQLFIAAVFGLVVIAILPVDWRLPTRLLTGWDAGVAFYLVMMQSLIWRCDIAHLRRRASEQDEGAFAILMLSMAATLASLIAIVFELGGLKHAAMNLKPSSRYCWRWRPFCCRGRSCTRSFRCTMRTNIMARAATEKIGGLNFPEDNEPDYLDFLYFSLVIGMTSQVSDVAITSKVIRRVVAAMHGVLSFFFNLTVLALTVNMISNICS